MSPANADPENTVSLMFGGDVMLGRTVNKRIAQHGVTYPLGAVAGLMRAADLTIVNLECAITGLAADAGNIWPGTPKAFYFGASAQAVHTLQDAGVDMVSLANNHVLDFGINGLDDTLRQLDAQGIRHAGAGADIAGALAPGIVERRGLRFGMVAFCDHQADFAARPDRAGMSYLDLDDERAATAALRLALEALRGAAIDWPILSLHWGPNRVFRPSMKFRRLAHAAVEMGWKIVFGHSAHVFQGIEIYRDCPIIYAAGDLVDDYYVDPAFNNDHQLLIELRLCDNRLAAIFLHPVFIDNCQARFASEAQFNYIAASMTTLCKELGSTVQRDGGKLKISAGPGLAAG